MQTAAYPWGSLPRLSRRHVRAARDVRAAAGAVPTPDAVATALGAIVAADVEVLVRSVTPFSEPPDPRRAVYLRADSGLALALEPEAALATAVLARLLNRPPVLTDPETPLDARAQGALAAVAVETARRAGAGVGLRALRGGSGVGAGLRVDCVVRLDRAPYALTVWAAAEPLRGQPEPTGPEALGALPLTLAVVAAASSGARIDVATLAPGDVWLPGDWLAGEAARRPAPTLTERVGARLALAAPSGERGVIVSRSGTRGIVVGGGVISLGADGPRPATRARDANHTEATMTEPDETLREIALDATVVVRVEVASVTLPAREWARLAPGDILATGSPLGRSVVLRVAGREVARGELVDVEGELGVAIRALLDPGEGA